MKAPTPGQSTDQRGVSHVGCNGGLAELRARFPKARLHFAPTLDCKRCSGTGVEPARRLSTGTMLNESPCACLFFGENTTWLAGLLAKTARDALSANVEISHAPSGEQK